MPSISAGPDDNGNDSAGIRYMMPQPNGTLLMVHLNIPNALFAEGELRMHGLETSGFVIQLDPSAGFDFRILGFIGNGRITMEQTSTKPGGAVTGSFEAHLSQLAPLAPPATGDER